MSLFEIRVKTLYHCLALRTLNGQQVVSSELGFPLSLKEGNGSVLMWVEAQRRKDEGE